MARKKQTEWKGLWSYKLLKYVGTGDFEGMDRPADHAPAWWRKAGVIDGDRYARAYDDATYHQDLRKEFWFATDKQIKAAHDLVNEWCDTHGFKRIRKLPERKARVSPETVRDLVKSGTFKRIKDIEKEKEAKEALAAETAKESAE